MNDLRTEFEDTVGQFVDISGQYYPDNQPWAPAIITKEQIDAEIERLASIPMPENGRRSSLIVHPRANLQCPGLAPTTQVTLNVLKPGERTVPVRHNAAEVQFCILGSGVADVGGRKIAFSQYDVYNVASWTTHSRTNDGAGLQVFLTYSNAALLQHMQVHQYEVNPDLSRVVQEMHGGDINPRRVSPYGTFEIGDDGAQLMPYEKLINPPAEVSPSLHWPWERVEAEIQKLADLGQDYVGRRLYLLYNPATGRTNGTTHNFFATITIRPPKIVDRPHRHISDAINYYFKGSGRSTVAGNTYEWKAGDLMLSAPGWAVHNHASYDDYVYELTIQTQPLHLAMDSLLWQENMKEPPALLGSQMGFDTNRKSVA